MASSRKTTTPTRKSTSAGRTSTRRSTTSKSAATAKTTKKPATRAKAPAKSSAKVAKPAAPVVTLVTDSGAASDATQVNLETFRRPDLIQAVADRTALKRSDAKAVLELVLEELGNALDGRDELVLPPLGKLSVKNRRAANNGAHLTLKLKRPGAKPSTTAQTALAEPDGDS